MDNIETIYVNIPCPTKEEAQKLCKHILEQDLAGTAKIYSNVHLMYPDPEKGVQGDDVVLISLKTTKKNLQAINEYIISNHSWGSPCIEVLPIVNDMC